LSHALAPRGAFPLAPAGGDYRHIQDVVRTSYPVRDAQSYLKRHLGNSVGLRLVEALRGERAGHVRSVEVVPADGGEPTFVRAVRLLPDGSPASYFTPDELVTVEAEIATPSGGPPAPLGARDRVVLHVPVRGYLRYLPGLYQGAVPAQRRDIVRADEASSQPWSRKDLAEAGTEIQGFNADPLRRFLFIFQHAMTSITDRIDTLPDLVDPATTDPRFLSWIASWISFELDHSLPVHQQRELVRRAIRLYRSRGTVAGIEEMIRVLAAAPAKVREREKPRPFVLGKATLAGGSTIEARYLRAEPAACFLAEPTRPASGYFALLLESRDAFSSRFGERAAGVLRRVAQVVTQEKPAHVSFTIRFAPGATAERG
jgi:phage tail-like protein